MNIVNTLTLRHLKSHKKRSVLTVLAIIVSVAMVTAVFTSAISFVKFFQNTTLAVDGNWHAKFQETDFVGNRSIYKNDKNIEEISLSAFYGSTAPRGNDKIQTPESVFIVDGNWFDMRNVTVSVGRYPKNSNEILVVKSFAEKDEKYAVGNTVTLDIQKENGEIVTRDFLVVGYTQSKVSGTDNVNLFVGCDDEVLKQVNIANVYVRYDKLDNSIWDKMQATANALGTDIQGYSYNTELFTYSGIMKDNAILGSLVGFAGILLLIIAVVSIFMIYDSFAVSYQERAKYLGMLSSVGATKKQKRMSVYFEGFILGAIGIPVGILSGVGGIAITFACIRKAFMATMAVEYDGTLKVYVNWIVILGTILASALTIFISSYIPARKASKTTAIEAIRQNEAVKIKNPKKLRTSKLVGKIFGYEGTLAAKNYKRNGRRSRNIVFSLFLSVVVFLTVMNFSSMFTDVMEASFNKTPDSMISTDCGHAKELSDAVKNTAGVEKSYIMTFEFGKIDASYFKDYSTAHTMDDGLNCTVVYLDRNAFDGYLRELSESTEKYHDKDNPRAILVNTTYGKKDSKTYSENPLNDISGKKINVQINKNKNEQGNNAYVDVPIEIGIQTTTLWSEETFSFRHSTRPVIIMCDEAIPDSLKDYSPSTAYIFVKDKQEIQSVIDQIGEALYKTDAEYLSASESGSSMNAINNILMITKVFVYGFITLITLISIMNIINTISNSMNERRREFAMLRSVGMTPKAFKRMIYLESFSYGVRSLAFSLPISVLIHFLMYKVLANSFDFGFQLNITPYLIASVAVFLIIESALFYSIDRINDDNIIDTLKTDVG